MYATTRLRIGERRVCVCVCVCAFVGRSHAFVRMYMQVCERISVYGNVKTCTCMRMYMQVCERISVYGNVKTCTCRAIMPQNTRCVSCNKYTRNNYTWVVVLCAWKARLHHSTIRASISIYLYILHTYTHKRVTHCHWGMCFFTCGFGWMNTDRHTQAHKQSYTPPSTPVLPQL